MIKWQVYGKQELIQIPVINFPIQLLHTGFFFSHLNTVNRTFYSSFYFRHVEHNYEFFQVLNSPYNSCFQLLTYSIILVYLIN